MKLFSRRQPIFFKLLREMGETMQEIVRLLEEFSTRSGDFERYFRSAEELEHKADRKIHEIIDTLNKTFITPFDREDVYLLAKELDDIPDLIEKVFHDIYLYRVTQRLEVLSAFAPLITEAQQCLIGLIECLEEQKYSERLLRYKIRIHELEDKGDAAYDVAMGKLFEEERDPVTIIKLKDIIEHLEDVLDRYQQVSDLIEGIVVKSA